MSYIQQEGFIIVIPQVTQFNVVEGLDLPQTLHVVQGKYFLNIFKKF